MIVMIDERNYRKLLGSVIPMMLNDAEIPLFPVVKRLAQGDEKRMP
jgi:hypothetical protein